MPYASPVSLAKRASSRDGESFSPPITLTRAGSVPGGNASEKIRTTSSRLTPSSPTEATTAPLEDFSPMIHDGVNRPVRKCDGRHCHRSGLK